MYPSSNHSSMDPSRNGTGGGNLTRYDSAPGSLLSSAVDSAVAHGRDFSASFGSNHLNTGFSRYFAPSDTSSLTTTTTSNSKDQPQKSSSSGLQRSYNFNDAAFAGGGGGSSSTTSSLVRHSSSPAGFLNQLASADSDNGFSLTRGMGNFNSKGVSDGGCGITRLNSQLSFTRQEALSHIPEESENAGIIMSNAESNQRKCTHSYASASFGMGSWDDDDTMMFSVGPNKRAKETAAEIDVFNSETQLEFGTPHTVIDMGMEKLMHIPEDSVPCKIRAKRGFATHPRSIAERERRTRISGKLKKLQDLVPNMDKQTSYADMLDLAVQHIKTLQTQVQKLNKELDNCTCGCKKPTQ